MFAHSYFSGGFFAPTYYPPSGDIIITPPVVTDPPISGSGGGRGGLGYTGQREDALRETRRKRILREDEEITALIMSMVTRGLI